jgi:maleylacetoacetate isomerase
VRIALNLKGIDYTYRTVHLVRNGGEQHDEEYTKLNASHLVPTLVIDGHQLSQSIAILEYLDETRPEPNHLLPQDAANRAVVRQLVHIIASDTQPVQNLRVLQKVGDDRKVEWAKHWISVGLGAFESVASRTAGKYSVGDSVTLADICLVPQVYNANRFGVDMSKYPTINRITEALNEIEAFANAVPDKMPDAE